MLTFERQSEQALLTYLDALRRRDAVLGYYEIQGLLFAVACSPEPVRPVEWFELIWLSDTPQFEEAGEAKAFFQLLLELSSHIDGEVQGERYRPGLDAQGRVSAQVLAQWCDGFLIGHQYLEELWLAALDDLDDDALFDQVQEALDSAVVFAMCENAVDESGDVALLAAHLQFQTLLEAYHSVQRRWGPVRKTWDIQDVYEDLESVSRDDQCPCGSGRLFARCCLH